MESMEGQRGEAGRNGEGRGVDGDWDGNRNGDGVGDWGGHGARGLWMGMGMMVGWGR